MRLFWIVLAALCIGAALRAEESSPDPAVGASNPAISTPGPNSQFIEPEKLKYPPKLPPARRVGPPKPYEVGVASYNIATKAVSRAPLRAVEKFNQAATPSFRGNAPLDVASRTVLGTDDRTQVGDTSAYPWRTIVKLFLHFPNGDFIGSGAIIGRSDSHGFHVLTAAHCVYDADAGGWADSIEVVPGMTGSFMPYGKQYATYLRTYNNWINNQDETDDFAVITLDSLIGDQTGWMGRATRDPRDTVYTGILNNAGYPGDLDGGDNMYFNSNNGDSASDKKHYYFMDSFGGQSGSPVWMFNSQNNERVILTVHAYGGATTNSGTRLNQDKFDQINTWIESDPLPGQDLRPELLVTSLTHSPDNPLPGQDITFTATIENQGASDAISFYVDFWADRANSPLATDTDQTDFQQVATLARGTSTTVTFTVSNPTTGAYTAWAYVDHDPAQIGEINESNNTKSNVYNVGTSGQPDLTVTSFTRSPANPNPGDTVTFTAVVRNTGTGQAGNFYLDFWAHRSSAPAPTDIDEFDFKTVNSLAPNESTTVSFALTNAVAGNFTAWVFADHDPGQVVEANETNNTASTPYTVGSGGGGSADLVVTSFTHSPANPLPGDSIEFSVTVHNQGTAPAANFYLDFWADRLNAPTLADTDEILYEQIDFLGAGASQTVTYTIEDAVSGTYTAWVFADHDPGKISESNENNNTGSRPYTVGAGPMIASGPIATPSAPNVGQNVFFGVSAIDSGGKPLTYSWNFGDGSTGTGASSSHIYLATGTYTVSVTVSNGTIEISKSISVTVGGAALNLSIAKMQIKLNFGRPALDSIAFSGVLPLPDGFSYSGRQMIVIVGGIWKTVTLDARGKGSSGLCTISMAKPKGGAAKYSIKMIGNFVPDLADEGLTSRDAKAAVVSVRADIVFNDKLFEKSQTLFYTAKSGKTGSAK